MGRTATTARRRCSSSTKEDVFKSYTYRILKNIHPNVGITRYGSLTVNWIIEKFQSAILEKAYELMMERGLNTMSAKLIEQAIPYILVGDIISRTLAGAKRAFDRYKSN